MELPGVTTWRLAALTPFPTREAVVPRCQSHRVNRLARLSHQKQGGYPSCLFFYGERDRTWCVLEYTWGGTGISMKGDDPAMSCWGGVAALDRQVQQQVSTHLAATPYFPKNQTVWPLSSTDNSLASASWDFLRQCTGMKCPSNAGSTIHHRPSRDLL